MITVPQGGTIAGQAAQAGPAQVSELGNIVSQFGDAINQKFGAIKAKQDEIKFQRTTLDLTKDIGVERQRFDQMTDPAQIEAEWPEFVAGLTEKYTNAKGPDGKPLLSPDQSAALGLSIQDLTTRHGLALGDRAITLTQSQATAAWTDARLDIVNTAATADADTMLAMIELGEGAIDKQLADGGMMPDEAATAKAALRTDVYNARAIAKGSEDPAGLLAELETDEYDALGPERKAALKVAAQAEVDRQAAAEVRAVKAATTEQTRVIGAKLADITALAGKGVTIADLDLLADPSFQAHPKYGEAAAAVSLAQEDAAIRQATPDQLNAAIAAEEASPKSEAYEAERLIVLRKWRDEAVKGWATDGAAQAKASGLPIPEVDVTDTENLAEGLAKSIAFSGQLAKDGYMKNPLGAVLDTAQRAEIKAMTAPDADTDQRLEIARAIALGTGGNTEALTRAFGLDPVFAEATRVLADTGNETLATGILRGQQKVENGSVILPTKASLLQVFSIVTGGVYDDDPAAQAVAMAASTALYADGARGLDPTSTENATAFQDDEEQIAAYAAAVRAWSGATADPNGDLTVGGLQPVRDRVTPLPVGISADDVETAMENIDFQQRGRAYNPNFDEWLSSRDQQGKLFQPGDAPDPMRALKAASVDGRLPHLQIDAGGNSAILEDLQIEKVPGTRDWYQFTYPVDGRSQVIGDTKRKPYWFRLPDLIKGASK